MLQRWCVERGEENQTRIETRERGTLPGCINRQYWWSCRESNPFRNRFDLGKCRFDNAKRPAETRKVLTPSSQDSSLTIQVHDRGRVRAGDDLPATTQKYPRALFGIAGFSDNRGGAGPQFGGRADLGPGDDETVVLAPLLRKQVDEPCKGARPRLRGWNDAPAQRRVCARLKESRSQCSIPPRHLAPLTVVVLGSFAENAIHHEFGGSKC